MLENGLVSWLAVGVLVMAAAVLVQTAILVAAALAGRRLMARVAALEEELRAAVGPTFSRLARVAENAEEVSDRLARGLPQLEEAIEGAAANVRRANQIFDTLESALLAPLRPLARGLALWRRLRGHDRDRVPLLEDPGP